MFKVHPLLAAIVVFVFLLTVSTMLMESTKCNNGWSSPSIGKQGACSHNGGVNNTPAGLRFLGSLICAVVTWGVLNKKNFNQPTHSSINTTSTISIVEKESNSIEVCCPKCDSIMVKRKARHGKNAGQYFYGCSKYPYCKGTRNIVV